MNTSLYDLHINTSRRVLEATIGVMEKGASHLAEQGVNLNDIVNMRLIDDMAPFSFQVNSVRHHSLGAVHGILAGEFTPPPEVPEMDYQQLISYLQEALAGLDDIDADAVAAIEGKAVVLKAGGFEMPFTSENFIQSFSFPNLYFHATTIYDMLRIKGVPLSKIDFLGNMAMGLPEA